MANLYFIRPRIRRGLVTGYELRKHGVRRTLVYFSCKDYEGQEAAYQAASTQCHVCNIRKAA